MDDSTERKDYVEKAIRTEAGYSKLPDAVHSILLCRLLHASIGLCTEVGELFEALVKPEFKNHAKEEIGDLWWYTAILYSALSRPLHPVVLGRQSLAGDHLRNIAVVVGNIQDVVKRSLFYGKPLDLPRLDTESDGLVSNLILLGHACGIRSCDAQDANIAKLTARYPEKFTEQKASERDLEKERSALG